MAERKRDMKKARLGIKARHQAVTTVLEENQDRFQELVERNRVELGLPRRSTQETPEQIRLKLEKAQARAERYAEQLREVEADMASVL